MDFVEIVANSVHMQLNSFVLASILTVDDFCQFKARAARGGMGLPHKGEAYLTWEGGLPHRGGPYLTLVDLTLVDLTLVPPLSQLST